MPDLAEAIAEAEQRRLRTERQALPDKLSIVVQGRHVASRATVDGHAVVGDVELLPGFTVDDARKLKGGEGAQFRTDAVRMVEVETARVAQLHEIVGTDGIVLACDGVIMDPADFTSLDAALLAAQEQVIAGEDEGDSDVKEIALVSAALMETARYQAVAAPAEVVAGPPVSVDAPAIVQSGTTLSCTMGNWSGEPTGYAYAWTINGSPVGSDAADYTATGADVGQSAGCTVTATNAQGSASASALPVIVA